MRIKKYQRILLAIGLIIFLVPFLTLFFNIDHTIAAEEKKEEAQAKPSACSAAWYAEIEGQSGDRGLFQGTSKICWACGDCTLCDFLGIANTVARLLMGLIGAVAFVAFVYGGISFIIAAGNAERVAKAKKVLINAVIGIVIVLLAWEIVNLTIGILAGQNIGDAANIFEKPWYEECKP